MCCLQEVQAQPFLNPVCIGGTHTHTTHACQNSHPFFFSGDKEKESALCGAAAKQPNWRREGKTRTRLRTVMETSRKCFVQSWLVSSGAADLAGFRCADRWWQEQDSKTLALSRSAAASNQEGSWLPRPTSPALMTTPRGRAFCWPHPYRRMRRAPGSVKRRSGAGTERCQVSVPGPCQSAAAEDPWPSRKCFRLAPTWLRPCGLRALCSASRVSWVASAFA